MTPPISEFFADAPLITPSAFHPPVQCSPGIQTAICTFLSEHSDQALLAPILAECRLLYHVYGRSGKVPIYQYREQCLIVLMTVGSPVAAAVIEELHYLGIRNVIAYGTAGQLDAQIPEDALVLLTRAIRDEGTSYHYLAPSVYVDTNPELTAVVAQILQGKAPLVYGITWTTDALFRETGARCARRKAQGAITVEMECAGFASAAKRLGLRFAEFVFFSDTLAHPEQWSMFGDQQQGNARRSLKVTLLTTLLDALPKLLS